VQLVSGAHFYYVTAFHAFYSNDDNDYYILFLIIYSVYDKKNRTQVAQNPKSLYLRNDKIARKK